MKDTKICISGEMNQPRVIIEFSFQEEPNINNFIKDLHPVPSGIWFAKKNISVKFIRNNEYRSRNLYNTAISEFSIKK